MCTFQLITYLLNHMSIIFKRLADTQIEDGLLELVLQCVEQSIDRQLQVQDRVILFWSHFR